MTATMAPATSSFVAAEGVRFHLWRSEPAEATTAPPTLLLHGVPETAMCWRDLMPALATDRIVLAPDLKGLGKSEVRGPYDSATMADELAALVLHEVDGKVDIVGHDWGGRLALAIARARPDLVRRLVIINAPYREIKLHRAPHVAAFALPGLPEVIFRLTGERLVRALLHAGWRSETPLDEEVAQHYAATYAEPERTAAMLGYYRAAARPAMATAIRKLARRAPAQKRPPVHLAVERSLVIWGADDPVLPISVGESVVRDLGSSASMVTLPGVGHFAPEEAPDIVVPTVAQFLRAP
ncbi:MAG: alpha/beta hydrolase [Mycobacteriales bacterium]